MTMEDDDFGKGVVDVSALLLKIKELEAGHYFSQITMAQLMMLMQSVYIQHEQNTESGCWTTYVDIAWPSDIKPLH